MVSKVRGKFGSFSATIETAENPLDSKVSATVDVASVDTGMPPRDEHLRTSDFFLAEEHPTFSFESTGVREENGEFFVDGNLTMRGVTKPVTFDFDFGGFTTDSNGNYKAGFTVSTVIKREEFGVNFNAPLETGGLMLSTDIPVTLELAMVLKQ